LIIFENGGFGLGDFYKNSCIVGRCNEIDGFFDDGLFHTHRKFLLFLLVHFEQGVTKRCRLSWLTNSVLVYDPKCGGGGGGEGCRVSANEYSCAHGDQINSGDLSPYLSYDFECKFS
jgi:hypothetical protein